MHIKSFQLTGKIALRHFPFKSRLLYSHAETFCYIHIHIAIVNIVAGEIVLFYIEIYLYNHDKLFPLRP